MLSIYLILKLPKTNKRQKKKIFEKIIIYYNVMVYKAYQSYFMINKIGLVSERNIFVQLIHKLVLVSGQFLFKCLFRKQVTHIFLIFKYVLKVFRMIISFKDTCNRMSLRRRIFEAQFSAWNAYFSADLLKLGQF